MLFSRYHHVKTRSDDGRPQETWEFTDWRTRLRSFFTEGHPLQDPRGGTMYRSGLSIGIMAYERMTARFGDLPHHTNLSGLSDFGLTLITRLPANRFYPQSYLLATRSPETNRDFEASVDANGAMCIVELHRGVPSNPGRFPFRMAAGFFTSVTGTFRELPEQEENF